MIYEMRTYVPVKGRSEAMRARFVDHVAKTFFPKHNIDLVAVFAPHDASDERLIYITRFTDDAARAKAWQAFSADGEWAAVKKASESDGPLLESQHATVLTSVIGGLLPA